MSFLVSFFMLPFALLSFLYNKLIRFYTFWEVGRLYRSHPEFFRCWNILSHDYLQQSGRVRWSMVDTPRWNPHAVIAGAGPFRVEESIHLDMTSIGQTVGYWFVGAYSLTDFKANMHFNSLSTSDEAALTLSLLPGVYVLVARYYLISGRVRFPAVHVDEREGVPPIEAPPDVNAFYADLQKRSNLSYLAMNYYIYFMLRIRPLFFPQWVERELLPTGNPDTQFVYGVLRSGQRLLLRIPTDYLSNHTVYFTAYTRSSFPIQWLQITESDFQTPAAKAHGFFVIRALQTSPLPDGVEATDLWGEMPPIQLQ